MLDNGTIRKIEEFVYLKPRSMQEISEHLKKNWRTVDRYVEEIIREYGTLDKRIFREGTRGALKIIYFASIERQSKNVFQNEMEDRIFQGRKKEDFSAFDIFQHLENKNKRAIIEEGIDEDSTNLLELKEILLSTKKELLIFSGNLSLVNLKMKGFDMMEVLESLAKRNVSIKVISGVNFSGRKNVENLLSISHKLGKNCIEIRHREQPLRALVIDKKIIRLKEIKESLGKVNELDHKIFIFYTLRDKAWGEWMSKIFWKMFNNSIGSEKRMSEISKLEFSKKII